ncbi:MAG: OadG family protein [Eubacteriales bacterium]|nr:OadG family protein [Eubacteriales bacterium]MDD3882322.1 OadG family protein [Eubacteriales bacterium]MDD4512068.1 OadG family protein [Eubacteriales bacterium]
MDKLVYSLSVMLVGIAIVFVGLVILIGCIKLISAFAGGKKKEAPTVKADIPAAPAAPAPAAQAAEVQNDDALIAVITAAISAVWENKSSGFTVRHIKRINNASAWQKAGREDQTYSRI